MVNYLSSFNIIQIDKSSLFHQVNNIINSEFAHNTTAASNDEGGEEQERNDG